MSHEDLEDLIYNQKGMVKAKSAIENGPLEVLLSGDNLFKAEAGDINHMEWFLQDDLQTEHRIGLRFIQDYTKGTSEIRVYHNDVHKWSFDNF